MRYYYPYRECNYVIFGKVYRCDHPIYRACTLYKIGDRGLAVIQQRFEEDTKSTWWSNIDSYLVDDIYTNKGFSKYFNEYAGEAKNGLYPTVTVRQIMWALKMKPIKRNVWETVFDKAPF